MLTFILSFMNLTTIQRLNKTNNEGTNHSHPTMVVGGGSMAIPSSIIKVQMLITSITQFRVSYLSFQFHQGQNETRMHYVTPTATNMGWTMVTGEETTDRPAAGDGYRKMVEVIVVVGSTPKRTDNDMLEQGLRRS